jgi:hypothetical protein
MDGHDSITHSTSAVLLVVAVVTTAENSEFRWHAFIVAIAGLACRLVAMRAFEEKRPIKESNSRGCCSSIPTAPVRSWELIHDLRPNMLRLHNASSHAPDSRLIIFLAID